MGDRGGCRVCSRHEHALNYGVRWSGHPREAGPPAVLVHLDRPLNYHRSFKHLWSSTSPTSFVGTCLELQIPEPHPWNQKLWARVPVISVLTHPGSDRRELRRENHWTTAGHLLGPGHWAIWSIPHPPREWSNTVLRTPLPLFPPLVLMPIP